MKGDEESILEDLFHYAFYSESKILIKFDIDKWKKKIFLDLNIYLLFSYIMKS